MLPGFEGDGGDPTGGDVGHTDLGISALARRKGDPASVRRPRGRAVFTAVGFGDEPSGLSIVYVPDPDVAAARKSQLRAVGRPDRSPFVVAGWSDRAGPLVRVFEVEPGLSAFHPKHGQSKSVFSRPVKAQQPPRLRRR